MIDTSISVLVVDDVATMRRILSDLLKRAGFENVETAESPPRAIQLLEQKTFGLVVSDWHMEGTTGLDLLNTIRGTPALRDIPVILISAESNEKNSAAAKNAGASGYLVKPFNSDTLKATITEAFELRDLGQTVYKGCVLMPQGDNTEYRCHILKDGTAIAVSSTHPSRHEAIDEAKLWVDQTGRLR